MTSSSLAAGPLPGDGMPIAGYRSSPNISMIRKLTGSWIAQTFLCVRSTSVAPAQRRGRNRGATFVRPHGGNLHPRCMASL